MCRIVPRPKVEFIYCVPSGVLDHDPTNAINLGPEPGFGFPEQCVRFDARLRYPCTQTRLLLEHAGQLSVSSAGPDPSIRRALRSGVRTDTARPVHNPHCTGDRRSLSSDLPEKALPKDTLMEHAPVSCWLSRRVYSSEHRYPPGHRCRSSTSDSAKGFMPSPSIGPTNGRQRLPASVRTSTRRPSVHLPPRDPAHPQSPPENP